MEEHPSLESYWRSVILFGRNVATYKFALAKSLIELAPKEDSFVTLEELSEPFSKKIIEHLKQNDKQITSKSSTFLNACRDAINNEISRDELISTTKKYGFNNVLDAFHIVNQNEISVKFFEKETRGRTKGIVITDSLYLLRDSKQFQNFEQEVEARWRLVETAWSMNVSPSLLEVNYDDETNIFYIEENNIRRTDVTSARDALNGYQKGKCFYCFDDISINSLSADLGDVDHFFPYVLQSQVQLNLNGVWNLVLACKNCNRGLSGKFAKVPSIKLLERLHKRNTFFIESHHPLRETLINQTGKRETDRISFLKSMDSIAINYLIHRWEPNNEFAPVF
ncbi:HNH endonuclease domain-containing protein [Alkalihalobacterium alkalinitrilicum]|uniref:HNH endonuclease domain-containing protein n=1 Tax=Alkalihalobacterium alkalinitrilicum TaxID=427920 RepID=UPI001EE40FB7|nr:HNH endonuclease domain-containing protein [Alkalihalobacterium alkalinitrilicum]